MTNAISTLVKADTLLPNVFGKEVNQASLMWLYRQRRARNIPYIKLGKDIFYNPSDVMASLSKRQTIKAR